MDVAEIQRRLNSNGYGLAEDGVYGPKTRAAVMDYQAKSGLVVDGEVGRKTMSSLGVFDSAYGSAPRERVDPAYQLVRSLAKARDLDSRVRERVKYEEGFGRPGKEGYAYKDTKGIDTVGHGFNLNDKGVRDAVGPDVVSGRRPIDKSVAESILAQKVPKAVKDTKSYVGTVWAELTDDQKEALVDMHYNMGSKANFPKMGEALKRKDFKGARRELLDSDYAKEVPNRAKRNADLIYFQK